MENFSVIYFTFWQLLKTAYPVVTIKLPCLSMQKLKKNVTQKIIEVTLSVTEEFPELGNVINNMYQWFHILVDFILIKGRQISKQKVLNKDVALTPI